MAHFGDNIVSFFKKAAVKMEELQVQTALGKSELEDKFEEFKNESNTQYQLLKSQVKATIQKDSEKWDKVKGKFEHLELQLALGKAETKELLEEQKKNLSKAFKEVKDLIVND